MKTLQFLVGWCLASWVLCDIVRIIIADSSKGIKSTPLQRYSPNLPSQAVPYHLRNPAPGYPASTWPLAAVKAQTYGGINFNGDNKTPTEGGDVNTRTDEISEDDINKRFINLGGLNGFAGQVAASAVGTVVGNAGANIAGNYWKNCNNRNRGRRSILMHKLEKRQAIESNRKEGSSNADPEVVNRLICPQHILGQGGSNNGGRYCDRCSCRDRECHHDCRKCSNGNSAWSDNNGNHNNGQNNNWSNSGKVNCGRCNCQKRDCKNTCLKCYKNNNNNNYPGNSGSSWSNNNNYPGNQGSSWGGNNNGGWSNSGWRNTNGVIERKGGDPEESKDGAAASNNAQGADNLEDGVAFGKIA